MFNAPLYVADNYSTCVGERQLCYGTSVLVLGLRLTAFAHLDYNSVRYALVAQRIEQMPSKHLVAGSIPAESISFINFTQAGFERAVSSLLQQCDRLIGKPASFFDSVRPPRYVYLAAHKGLTKCAECLAAGRLLQGLFVVL